VRAQVSFEAEPNTGTCEHEFHVRGEAEHVKVRFTYEAKPSMGKIGASTGNSLLVQVMNDTFCHDANVHTLPTLVYN
jgi:hypothetical protein